MLREEDIKNHFNHAEKAYLSRNEGACPLYSYSHALALIDETEALIEQSYDVRDVGEEEEATFEEISEKLDKFRSQIALELPQINFSSDNKVKEEAWSHLKKTILGNDKNSSSELEECHKRYQKFYSEYLKKNSIKSLISQLKKQRDGQERKEAFQGFMNNLKEVKVDETLRDILSHRPQDFLENKAQQHSFKDLEKLDQLIRSISRSISGHFKELSQVAPWDYHYRLTEKLSEQKVATETYFESIYNLLEEKFKITLKKVERPSWHEEVDCLEVLNSQGIRQGFIYIDKFSREDKYHGAWAQMAFSRRVLPNEKIQLPTCFLGFSLDDEMSFEQSRPVLHEFGHALEHILNPETEYYLSGINALTFDTQEISSLMMESFISDPSLLELFEKPEVLKEAYRSFQIDDMASLCLWSAIDLALHRDEMKSSQDIYSTIDNIKEDLNLNHPFVNRFTIKQFDHAFYNNDYAGSYYGYLIGLVYGLVLKSSSNAEAIPEYWNLRGSEEKLNFLNKLIARDIKDINIMECI